MEAKGDKCRCRCFSVRFRFFLLFASAVHLFRLPFPFPLLSSHYSSLLSPFYSAGPPLLPLSDQHLHRSPASRPCKSILFPTAVLSCRSVPERSTKQADSSVTFSTSQRTDFKERIYSTQRLFDPDNTSIRTQKQERTNSSTATPTFP